MLLQASVADPGIGPQAGRDAPEPGRGPAVLRFDAFELLVAGKLLTEHGRPLRLGNRAFDILRLLAERAGEVVSHQEIRRHVWQGVYVEDANLRVHIAGLRKVLGDGQGDRRFILNLPGQGYSFVAPVVAIAAAELDKVPDAAPPPAAPPPGPARLPLLLTRLVGREAELASIASLLGQRRLVTLVGPGGIGKTSLALAAGWAMVDGGMRDLCFVDLAPLADPALVPSAVASALGLSVPSQAPLAGLVGALGQRRLLILLDNCEHLIDAAAGLAEALLRGAPGLRILATSREPLLAEGEWVHRVDALGLPPEADGAAAEELLLFPSVQLFVERATAHRDSFRPTEAAAQLIATICRQLDGIPLAIELAAAQLGMLSVQELSERLKDRLSLLARGRRTALPRQQTLRATLDWSHGLLSEAERQVLHRLAIFAGGFTLDAAIAVVPEAADRDDIVDQIARLASKSLLAVDLGGDTVRYRLLHTTRAYALDRLGDGPEVAALARRHATYCETLMRGAAQAWKDQPAAQWRETYCRSIDDLRLALDWAFGAEGDAGLGCRLTASSAPVWFQLALVDEYRERLERALALGGAALAEEPALAARIHLALGTARYNTDGPGPGMLLAYTRAAELAAAQPDASLRVQAAWGLGGYHCVTGDYAASLAYCRRIGTLAGSGGGEEAHALHDRVMAWGLHLVGQHEEARRHAEQAMAWRAPSLRSAHGNFLQYDHQVAVRSHLARILWIQGRADQAGQMVEEALTLAEQLEYPPPMCHLLVAAACPLAIWNGDIAGAKTLVARLHRLSSNLSFEYWRSWVTCYETAIALHEGEAGIDLRDTSAGPFHRDILATLHVGFVDDLALARAEAGQAGWCAPEILRGQGEALLRRADAGRHAATAEALFRRALEQARESGALAWELRAANSLARLRPDARHAILAPLLTRFAEAQGTADWQAASALLASRA
ncbi:ATP-binding protein [Roseomonas sp. F4]